MVKNIWKQTSGSGQGGSRGKEKVKDKVKTQAYTDLKSEKSINTRHRFIIRAGTLWKVGPRRKVEASRCYNGGAWLKKKKDMFNYY